MEKRGSMLRTWLVAMLAGGLIMGAAIAISIGIFIDDGGTSSDVDRSGVAEPAARGDAVAMTVHVMSMCPHGIKTLKTLTPIARELGSRYELKVAYIGRAQGDKLVSTHGGSEVLGDMIQLCVRQHAPYEAWLNFLDCQNERWQRIPEGWERCAQQGELDVAALQRCFEGGEGERLLRASFELSREKGVRGSPTIFLDDAPYHGGRSARSLALAICGAYQGEPPSGCAELAAPREIPVTLLFDERCRRPECDFEEALRGVEKVIAGARIERLAYDTPEGRQLFERTGVELLPALVIGREVEQDPDLLREVRQRTTLEGDFYIQRLARFDPVSGAWRPHPEVSVTYLRDERCTTPACRRQKGLDLFLERFVPNAKTSTLDYSTEEGRALWERIAAESAEGPESDRERPLGLPLAVFSPEITDEDQAYRRIRRRMRTLGDQVVYQLGSWDPTAEICDNDTDDDGDGDEDCDDPDCLQAVACRPEVPAVLRLHLMSGCPYGHQVLRAMGDVLASFADQRSGIDFRVDFIGEVGENGELSSVNGRWEVAEDLRQICVQHFYDEDDQFMFYMLCRSQDIHDDDWERCLREPFDVERIRGCAEGPLGRRLLTESFQRSQELGFRASPTLLLNNRYVIDARGAEEILRAFCQRNEIDACSEAFERLATTQE